MSRFRSFALVAAAVALVAFACGVARAEVPVPDRRFFVRLSGGAAYLRDSWNPSGNNPGAVFTGAGPSLDLSIGKSVRPRLVVGALWQLVNVNEPAESYLGVTYVAPRTERVLDIVAAFADYYPNPRRELHVGGGVGLLAASNIDRECCVSTRWGAALSVRVGYDFFFSRKWSIGALAQIEAYRYSSSEANTPSATYGLLPAVALALTFDWGPTARRRPTTYPRGS